MVMYLDSKLYTNFIMSLFEILKKETFYSFYGGHGDWSNPGQDPNGWPNTTYADYFNVETFSVK